MAASASTKTAVGRRVSPASLLGVEPAELMLVAAHPWDLNGACAAGLQTAFIERPLEFGSDSPVYEDPGADASAADLHELAQRLAN
jgi:2-haloacid dehalogenase